MIHDLAEEREADSRRTPHLSYSRINRYLHCPEQYRLYYVENLRLRHPPANLVFGQIVHQALAGTGCEPQWLEVEVTEQFLTTADGKTPTFKRLVKPDGAMTLPLPNTSLPTA